MQKLYDNLTEQREGTLRLLTVYHGTSDLIECSLDTALLGDHPRYEALSYTWGTENPVESILINGHVFYVRRNLWAFLKRLQKLAKATVVWIDAIFVDQTNIPERNQQVQLMSQIYSDAERVRVWLGEDPLGKLRLFETVTDEASFKDRRWVTRKIRWMRERRRQAALKTLMNNPYWRRVWIVQEFMLAKTVLMEFGASGSMSFRLLCNWYAYYEGKRGHLTGLLADKARTLLEVPLLVPPPTLWILLCHNYNAECSDPRDRLYASLGVACDSEVIGIEIDYSITFEELCAKVKAALAWHEAIAREQAERSALENVGDSSRIGQFLVHVLRRDS